MDLQSASAGLAAAALLGLAPVSFAQERAAGLPSDQALEAEGAVIGTITFDVENVFDNTDPRESGALYRAANRLHPRTKPQTLKSQLLFERGSPYSRRVLEESERVLRKTRYLTDARIRPVAYHDGEVDVVVRTQDTWTLNPGLSFGRAGGKNHTSAQVQELNLSGLGTELSLGLESDVDRDSATVRYHDHNLFGSWWDGLVELGTNSDGHRLALGIEHPFYSLEARRAEGFSVRDESRIDVQYLRGEPFNRFETTERRATLYGGLSGGLRDGWSRRWTAGVTFDAHRFQPLDEPGATTLLPEERRLIYPWIGLELVQDHFVTTRNHDQIARTEDQHRGWHLSSQLGFAASALGSDRSAFLLDAALSKGFEPTERQTLLLAASLSGRLDGGEPANVLASASARYYLRQSARWLLFTTARIDSGSHLDAERQLLQGGDSGLRGYPLRYRSGDRLWLVTVEQRLFTSWYPFRLVNVGAAAFADIGGAQGSGARSPAAGEDTQKLLSDVGFGLRLGNRHSALGNVLHVDVALPLNGSSSVKDVQLLIETKESF